MPQKWSAGDKVVHVYGVLRSKIAFSRLFCRKKFPGGPGARIEIEHFWRAKMAAKVHSDHCAVRSSF